jgi:hypothetical protein
MAASVLDSERAVQVSIYVVRAFVQLREILSSNKLLAHKLNELERKFATHDRAITGLIEAIRQLMARRNRRRSAPSVSRRGETSSPRPGTVAGDPGLRGNIIPLAARQSMA